MHTTSSALFSPEMTPEVLSTFDQYRVSGSNVTSYLYPSPKDLWMLVPRIISRASSFAFVTVPEHLENMLGIGNGGRVIAEATREGAHNMASVALSSTGMVHEMLPEVSEAIATEAAGDQRGSISQGMSFQQIRNFGGVFSYVTSKWALGCFTVAIILNRTQIYASSRRHLNLNLSIRLALRIVPIIMFLHHIYSILQSLHCQTSPQYPSIKYGDPGKHIMIDFGDDGGLLHYFTSILLFWQSDTDSCLAVNMIPSDEGSSDFRGSLPLLWPVFQSICLSQFIETLSCAVQGRPVMTETGMSIFEHSLAFAEAEAMVNNHIGFRAFGPPKANVTKTEESMSDMSDSTPLVTENFLLNRLNTPPEVLLMSLISCLNNLSSQILGVLGWQARYRLINTGIWGLCFMGSFVWGFASFSFEPGSDAGILRFPTVCIVGFIPHLLILAGISVCACIYFFAFLLSVISPPVGLPPTHTWRERFQVAQENLQANIHISQIHLNMQEDFYTALLRIGFAALTAASEAVYLNEGRQVDVRRWTWLEEERLNEIEGSRAKLKAASDLLAQQLSDGGLDTIASGIALFEEKDSSVSIEARQWRSGYNREKSTKALKGGPSTGNLGNARMGADGVGALQRGGRYILAWDFLTGIFWLVTGWVALGVIKILRKVGIRRKPSWMERLLGKSKPIKETEQKSKAADESSLDFWLLSDEGVLSLPQNDNVDVENETKKRQRIVSDTWGEQEEQRLDKTLYDWWSHGGWWGERDESGEFQVPEQDEDSTSVISMSTDHSEAEWESDADDEGRRTPTQQAPYPRTREASPISDLSLDALQLARLLNPQDAEQRQEARILAHHLSSDRIITRSQYRTFHDLDNAHILTSTRYRPAGFKPSSANGRLTPFEESEVLEHLIVSRRGHHAAVRGVHNEGVSSWNDGAEGLGAGGPQCVVCQSSPRTILAWPCRCLSLCEECRVSLAMNNFGTCVCCRQEVVGFSRLFVP